MAFPTECFQYKIYYAACSLSGTWSTSTTTTGSNSCGTITTTQTTDVSFGGSATPFAITASQDCCTKCITGGGYGYDASGSVFETGTFTVNQFEHLGDPDCTRTHNFNEVYTSYCSLVNTSLYLNTATASIGASCIGVILEVQYYGAGPSESSFVTVITDSQTGIDGGSGTSSGCSIGWPPTPLNFTSAVIPFGDIIGTHEMTVTDTANGVTMTATVNIT